MSMVRCDRAEVRRRENMVTVRFYIAVGESIRREYESRSDADLMIREAAKLGAIGIITQESK